MYSYITLILLDYYCFHFDHNNTPGANTDETRIVTKLIERRLETPKDEPWFSWDDRYEQDPSYLKPDFSKYKMR